VDISYENAKLEKLCLDSRSATRELGPDGARKMSARCADLKAASNVLELPAGHPHPLKGDRYGQFAVSLAGAHRLVFRPDHDPIPSTIDGGIAWGSVTKIIIVFVGNYHDE
jgi:proteic killer suppression protein